MTILDVRYDNITISKALERVLSFLTTSGAQCVFFLNAHGLYESEQHPAYRSALNSAELVLPDGIGLRIATRLCGDNMIANCNGTDFSPLLIKHAAEEGYRVFFLGGKEGVAKRAAHNMQRQFPTLQIAGVHSGYFEGHERSVIDKINQSQVDILFVAMGIPVQELWITKNKEIIQARVILAVGALLDFLSGRIERAPKLLRIIHMEWVWRILLEPRRLFKRYLIDDIRIFWTILKQRHKKPTVK